MIFYGFSWGVYVKCNKVGTTLESEAMLDDSNVSKTLFLWFKHIQCKGHSLRSWDVKHKSNKSNLRIALENVPDQDDNKMSLRHHFKFS